MAMLVALRSHSVSQGSRTCRKSDSLYRMSALTCCVRSDHVGWNWKERVQRMQFATSAVGPKLSHHHRRPLCFTDRQLVESNFTETRCSTHRLWPSYRTRFSEPPFHFQNHRGGTRRGCHRHSSINVEQTTPYLHSLYMEGTVSLTGTIRLSTMAIK
jgi:hypothetical protein